MNIIAFMFISMMMSACCRLSLQVNESVLRPASMEQLLDLQLAEELIKQEMITMLHHDCLHHPSANAASQLLRGKTRGPTSTSNNASHIAYLETHPYKPVSTEEMEQVTHTLLFSRQKLPTQITDQNCCFHKTCYTCVRHV